MQNKYLEKIASFTKSAAPMSGMVAKLPSLASSVKAPEAGSILARIAEKRKARMMADIGSMKGRTGAAPVRR